MFPSFLLTTDGSRSLQMSAETGGSIENIMESISTSVESLTTIIPVSKRQELAKFEMTLKEMIEEARQMAKTPESSHEDLSLSRPEPQPRPSSALLGREEFGKSPSVQVTLLKILAL